MGEKDNTHTMKFNIKQAPSGSWYVRKRINGKEYYLNFEKKPSQHEVEGRIDEIKQSDNPLLKGTFETCAEEYISSKSHILSPSTIASYHSIMNNLSKSFLRLKMAQITQLDVQREINIYSVERSPKSVRNASGFITAVIWYFRPNLELHTQLPQRRRVDTYIPTDEEVKRLVEVVKGTKFEAVILLAIFGLRKSEAIAVTKADLNGNILTIDKSIVKGEKGSFVKKVTKTESSTRRIWIPNELRDLIIKQGKAFEGYPHNLVRDLHRFQEKAGIPYCKFHALRHYYISYAHSIGIPDAYIAEVVGHKNTNTTRAVYLHSQQDKNIDMQQKVAQSILR